MIDLHTLRLRAQIGLFSYVTADLRAVCLKRENQDLIVAFFCGDELSEELEDSAQVATTEMVSCVPQEGLIHTQFVHGDYPKPMALFGELVYLRYEPGCEVYPKKLPKEVFTEVKSSNLRLAGQRALLGRVTANLRSATICEVGNTIFVHFWYDNTISELDYRLARETTAEVKEAFQLSDPRVFDFKIQQLPFPQRIVTSNCDYIFDRYEPSLPEDFL